MKIYKPGVTQLSLGGQTFSADDDGVLDLPDHLATPGLFAAGWVDARGRLAQLERERAAVGEPAQADPAASQPRPAAVVPKGGQTPLDEAVGSGINTTDTKTNKEAKK